MSDNADTFFSLMKRKQWKLLMPLINASLAQSKDGDGLLALPLAICFRAPTKVLLALLQAYPEAVFEKDELLGSLPLHIASENAASYEVIMALLEMNLQAVAERDNENKTPLDYAIEASSNLNNEEIVAALRSAYQEVVGLDPSLPSAPPPPPQSLSSLSLLSSSPPPPWGDFPLHNALRQGASTKVLLGLLSFHADASETRDLEGKLPLVIAVEHSASLEVIAAIHDAYPLAAHDVSLFHLIERNAWPELELLLTYANASAVNVKGRMPFHVLLESKNPPSAKLYLALLRACPDVLSVKDELGYSPLFVAIENQVSHEVLLAMIELYPEAAAQQLAGVHDLFSQERNKSEAALAILELQVLKLQTQLEQQAQAAEMAQSELDAAKQRIQAQEASASQERGVFAAALAALQAQLVQKEADLAHARASSPSSSSTTTSPPSFQRDSRAQAQYQEKVIKNLREEVTALSYKLATRQGEDDYERIETPSGLFSCTPMTPSSTTKQQQQQQDTQPELNVSEAKGDPNSQTQVLEEPGCRVM